MTLRKVMPIIMYTSSVTSCTKKQQEVDGAISLLSDGCNFSYISLT